jgi:hypothetical protein
MPTSKRAAKAPSNPKAPSYSSPSSRRSIAARSLLYSVRGDDERKPFTLCITEPFLLTGDVGFKYAPGAAGCTVFFDGLPEFELTVHGVDRIQALELAVDVDPILRGLNRRKYDFFWEDGEPYFEPI